MRLLNVNNYHYRRGGSDAIYFDHAAIFENNGWECAFFSMHHSKNVPSVWSDYFVEEIEFGGDYSIAQKISMASKIVYSLEAKNKIGRLLDKFKADVAHLHCIYHHLSPSIISSLKGRGVKTFITAHDLKILCPAYKMLNNGAVCEKCLTNGISEVVKNKCVKNSGLISSVVFVEAYLHRFLNTYKMVDAVVVPSLFYRKKFIEWGFPEEKLIYIPNFIDADLWGLRKEIGDYFVYAGRLSEEKGLWSLFDSMGKSGAELHVIGTGPLEVDLKKYVEKNNLPIKFLGYMTGEALRSHISFAKALILPSEWYENAPVSVLEAHALGVPVIGAEIGGIPELIPEESGSLIFKSGSVDDLADCILRIENMSKSEIVMRGEQGRKFVTENFSKKLYFDRMVNLYK